MGSMLSAPPSMRSSHGWLSDMLFVIGHVSFAHITALRPSVPVHAAAVAQTRMEATTADRRERTRWRKLIPATGEDCHAACPRRHVSTAALHARRDTSASIGKRSTSSDSRLSASHTCSVCARSFARSRSAADGSAWRVAGHELLDRLQEKSPNARQRIERHIRQRVERGRWGARAQRMRQTIDGERIGCSKGVHCGDAFHRSGDRQHLRTLCIGDGVDERQKARVMIWSRSGRRKCGERVRRPIEGVAPVGIRQIVYQSVEATNNAMHASSSSAAMNATIAADNRPVNTAASSLTRQCRRSLRMNRNSKKRVAVVIVSLWQTTSSA